MIIDSLGGLSLSGIFRKPLDMCWSSGAVNHTGHWLNRRLIHQSALPGMLAKVFRSSS